MLNYDHSLFQLNLKIDTYEFLIQIKHHFGKGKNNLQLTLEYLTETFISTYAISKNHPLIYIANICPQPFLKFDDFITQLYKRPFKKKIRKFDFRDQLTLDHDFKTIKKLSFKNSILALIERPLNGRIFTENVKWSPAL